MESWFARPVAKCLKNVGLVTLADLVCFINLYGYRWHTRISGFGALRARQAQSWLQLQQDTLALSIAATWPTPWVRKRPGSSERLAGTLCRKKPSTQRSYRKEVERFMLWCAQDLKKPLFSVNALDCQRYREFLQKVPAA